MPIQFLIIVFILFAIFKAWRAYVSGVLDRRKLLLWSSFWLVVAVVILSPQTTTMLANILGVGRGVDLALYVSVVVLFYVLFTMSRKVDGLEKSLTNLVRAIALKNAEHDSSKKQE